MFEINISPGSVNVHTSNGPLPPEEWAKLAADKIIFVGHQTEGPIKEQVIAYKRHIQKVVEYYIKQAVLSHEKHLIARIK